MAFSLTKFVDLLKIVGPPLLAISGVPAAVIPFVIHGIEIAESKPVTGAEKKAVALDAVKTGIGALNVINPDTPKAADVEAVVANGIDTVIGGINLFKPKA